jgi:hypothetical protein
VSLPFASRRFIVLVLRVGGICLNRKYLEPFDGACFGEQDLEAQAVDFE